MIKEWPVPMSDRREEVRYSVTLEVFWQGPLGRSTGTISDLNRSGCYILTGDKVKPGETIHVFIEGGDEMNVQFTGVVTNQQDEIGFAVKFNKLSEIQGRLLDELIYENAQA